MPWATMVSVQRTLQKSRASRCGRQATQMSHAGVASILSTTFHASERTTEKIQKVLKSGDRNHSGRTFVCFPHPNRLKMLPYTFQGKT